MRYISSLRGKLKTKFWNAYTHLQASKLSATTTAVVDTSQAGELHSILSLMKPSSTNFFVDVGAHDGKYLSNSWPLVKMGWRGILIEPLPKVFTTLTKNYAGINGVTLVNKACSNISGIQQLYVGSDGDTGQMSTLCADDNEWFRQNRTTDFVEVQVDRLSNILTDCDAPHNAFLLLVDAEGMDYEVLQGLDIGRYQPEVIVTEEYASNPDKHQKKYALLRDYGYTYRSLVGYNTIWERTA